MTPDQLNRRDERALTEPLVISEVPEGFRVHSPTGRSRPYVVSGTPDAPVCSCPDFQKYVDDPDWRCKHILAVLSRREPQAVDEDSYEREERRAIQEEASSGNGSANGTAQMLLKRSVSPDGRIDALSVEFTCPVDMGNGEAEIHAARMLELQSTIADRFLNGGPVRSSQPDVSGPEAVPAEMLDVGGMDTKWGRRLFLRFRVNGQVLRRFGSEGQLSECIASAGYPDLARAIFEGKELSRPCLVTTVPSKDGRYVNVDRVLPAQPAGGWN